MSSCRSCGAADLSSFLSLGVLPLSDGFLKKEQLGAPEPRYPLDVALCTECTLVQILHTVPPEELFCRDYPYFSSFTDTLLQHSRENALELIKGRGLGERSLVVELASNDGYLLQYFRDAGVAVLGIDPAEGPARAAIARGIRTLNTFFGEELAERLVGEGQRADVILANNVLAHVADLNGFVEGIRVLLAPEGIAVIEVPYVRELIDKCEFDTIYHEHLCYFSATALDRLFRRHDLYINRIRQLPIHGGSLRLYVEKRDAAEESVSDLLTAEAAQGLGRPEYYEDFASRVRVLRERLHAMLTELKTQGRRLAAYGAAAKGTILLNHVGIGRELLSFVVDRNVHKQGRYVPGVRLPIVDPEQLLAEMPDYVLLLPWNFKAEILAQQAEYRRRGGRFIVPIPTPEII